jgi:prevent-host-death family protein
MPQQTVSVRDAKARFSALVAEVANGATITVTSHGVPKAQLGPCDAVRRVPMRVDRAWLQAMPLSGDMARAETLVRQERDGRD